MDLAEKLALCAPSYRPGFYSIRSSPGRRIHLGRSIAFDPESMHCWPPRIEGDLDHHSRGLLPTSAHDLLGFTQVRRLKSSAISYSQCTHARRLGGIALAGAATTSGSRSMARSSALGVAPNNGAIGRLGDRIKKYSVVPVLPFIDL